MGVWLAIAAAVLLVLVVAVIVSRRRAGPSEIRRDAPTVERPLRIGGFGDRIGALLRRGVDQGFWSGLEEALISADVGVASSVGIVERVRARGVSDPAGARRALRAELLACFADRDRSLNLGGAPSVVVVVGVNGSGKTTTIAKLAAMLQREGRSVLLAAADTFRAAAADQLREWGRRLGADVVAGEEGGDAAAVAHDALSAARARHHDVVVVDTAGRLHSKQNLMEELAKVVRVLSRGRQVDEVLLVLDGSTGQNGIAQARAFTSAVGVTGTAIAKLDGTAKGGVAVAVESELGIPVKLVGVGESLGDLLTFDPEWFVDSVLEGT